MAYQFIYPTRTARCIPTTSIQGNSIPIARFSRTILIRPCIYQYHGKWWYRHACAAGAVLNILMMMGANLVGFVLGTQGVSYMLEQLFASWEGKLATYCPSFRSYQDPFPNTLPIIVIRFMVFTCTCLFVAAQVLFEYRYVVY